jgi:hypothetical protein
MKNKPRLIALAQLVYKAATPRPASLKALRALGWVSGTEATPEGRAALQKGASEALNLSAMALGNYNAATERGSDNVAARELEKSQRYLDLANTLEAKGAREDLAGADDVLEDDAEA